MRAITILSDHDSPEREPSLLWTRCGLICAPENVMGSSDGTLMTKRTSSIASV
jgi:hypothetical protein